jgi:hypothetical protein
MNADEMLIQLQEWYNKSCGLRFIQQVSSVAEGEDPNAGFTNLIPQGYEAEFCVSCEYSGANLEGYCDDCVEDEEDED